jgi:hypothetical protein
MCAATSAASSNSTSAETNLAATIQISSAIAWQTHLSVLGKCTRNPVHTAGWDNPCVVAPQRADCALLLLCLHCGRQNGGTRAGHAPGLDLAPAAMAAGCSASMPSTAAAPRPLAQKSSKLSATPN